MIRATTGGVLKSYRANLMNSFIGMNKSRDTVLSQRIFNSFAEDPAAAAKAFRLRKSRMTVDSQHSICSDTLKKYQTAFSCLQSMDEALDTDTASPLKTISGMTKKWLNDPTGDAREQLSKALEQVSELLVQDMNQKYGDNFIFAGADGHNVPFEIKDNKLYYRGVSVDAAVPKVVMDGTDLVSVDANGNLDPNGNCYICTDSISTMKAADFDAKDPTDQPKVMKDATGAPVKVDADGNFDPAGEYVMLTGNIKTMTKDDYDAQKLEAEKLEYLKNEKYYVDIGLGFQENENGELIPSSGFNAALNGINFFGCGLDEDGDPKNIYSIVQRLKEITESVPDGEDWSQATYDEFDALVGKLEDASSNFKTEYANMDAGTLKLKNNLDILEDNFYNLDTQTANLEDVDMVEAISSFIWAEYAYNAALKVGNSILSQSLMDYMT